MGFSAGIFCGVFNGLDFSDFSGRFFGSAHSDFFGGFFWGNRPQFLLRFPAIFFSNFFGGCITGFFGIPVIRRHNGLHVTEVLSVDSSTATPAAPRRSSFRTATSNGSSSGTTVEETGTVKWFNAERGYGLIALDGSKDVFVHISALEKSGLTGLAEGQHVVVDLVEGRKGLEAARVRLV